MLSLLRAAVGDVTDAALGATVTPGNPPMPLLYAQELLTPETVAAILELGQKAEQIADRWAMGWPKRTRELERQGILLEKLSIQAERESRATRQAAEEGITHLAEHEIAELWGLSLRPP